MVLVIILVYIYILGMRQRLWLFFHSFFPLLNPYFFNIHVSFTCTSLLFLLLFPFPLSPSFFSPSYSINPKKAKIPSQANWFVRQAVLEARASKRASFIWTAYLPIIFFAYGFVLGECQEMKLNYTLNCQKLHVF